MMLRDPAIPLASATRESVQGQVRALLSGGQGTRMDQALAMEIERSRKLKTKALQARYRELFGEESRSSNRAHLFRRIAWRLQAKAQGHLSERARKRAVELADDADLRLRAPRRFWRVDVSVGVEPTPARDPKRSEERRVGHGRGARRAAG